MKAQYEQQCNAEALRCMGVPVIPKLRKKHASRIRDWIDSDYRVQVAYPDDTEQVIRHVLDTVYPEVKSNLRASDSQPHSLEELQIPSL
jgi:hypothetical protein